MIKELSASDLGTRIRSGDASLLVLDVREAWEIATAAIPGTLNIPMNSIPSRLGDIPQDKEIAVLCHHGNRSRRVADFLVKNGFENVYNVSGGIAAWSRDVDPKTPTY